MTVVDFAFTGPGSFLDPIWRWRGRVIAKENLVHIPWFTRPWKVLGLSPLQAYAARFSEAEFNAKMRGILGLVGNL